MFNERRSCVKEHGFTFKMMHCQIKADRLLQEKKPCCPTEQKSLHTNGLCIYSPALPVAEEKEPGAIE